MKSKYNKLCALIEYSFIGFQVSSKSDKISNKNMDSSSIMLSNNNSFLSLDSYEYSKTIKND